MVANGVNSSIALRAFHSLRVGGLAPLLYISEMTSVQPKRSLFSASPTERKGCLLLAVGSKKKGDLKNVGKKDK